jgi:hypothetical protein
MEAVQPPVYPIETQVFGEVIFELVLALET